MPRGFPSSAVRKPIADIRDYRPIKPIQPGLPRPRPANDRGTFLQGRRDPRFGKADPLWIRERDRRFKENAKRLIRDLPEMVIRAALPSASNAFDLGDNVDQMLGGKNNKYVLLPDFSAAGGRSKWMMLNGPNSPRILYYGIGLDYGNLWSANAYLSRGGYDPARFRGPGTGVIAGQSISEVGATFGRYTPGVNATSFGLWYYSKPLGQTPQGRGAQILNFYRPGYAGMPGSYATNDPINMANAYGWREVPVQWFQPMPEVGSISAVVGAALPEYLAPGHMPVPSTPLSPGLARRLDPWRWPGHLDQGEPARQPDPLPPPQPALGPGVSRYPISKPGHVYKRPGRNEHEGKYKGRHGKLIAFQKLAGDVLGGFSEAADFMDALHDALPKRFQAKSWYHGKRIKPSWNKKWNAVYQHFSKIDMNEALTNVLKNDMQDKAIGKASRRANQMFKKPPGVMLDRMPGKV